MAKKKKIIPTSNYLTDIVCPVDLDSLIMSSECSPSSIEQNLDAVGDDTLFDAIRLSTCSNYLLGIGVLEGFSSGFRRRIWENWDAFPMTFRLYAEYKMELSNRHVGLNEERKKMVLDSGATLFNPLNMLGNGNAEMDRRIVDGEIGLSDALVERIRKFLADGSDKSLVDFSYSIHLLELLSPWFFKGVSDAEQTVILANLGKYFKFLGKFKNSGSSFSHPPITRDVFLPLNLVKHIFSSDAVSYSSRTKMLAWSQLFSHIKEGLEILSKKSASSSSLNRLVGKFVDTDAAIRLFKPIEQKLDESGLSQQDVVKWIETADGVFESFELDCTLHNIDATMFFIPFFVNPDMFNMVDGMIKFQDEDRRNEMFKLLAEMLKSFHGQ